MCIAMSVFELWARETIKKSHVCMRASANNVQNKWKILFCFVFCCCFFMHHIFQIHVFITPLSVGSTWWRPLRVVACATRARENTPIHQALMHTLYINEWEESHVRVLMLVGNEGCRRGCRKLDRLGIHCVGNIQQFWIGVYGAFRWCDALSKQHIIYILIEWRFVVCVESPMFLTRKTCPRDEPNYPKCVCERARMVWEAEG